MEVGLHQFHAQAIGWFQKAVSTPGISRNALARELCERGQWNDTTGELCVASARKALPILAARLGVVFAGNTTPAPTPQIAGLRSRNPANSPRTVSDLCLNLAIGIQSPSKLAAISP